MARDGIDLSELDEFTDRLIRTSKKASKVQRRFLQQQGNKLKRKTKAQARVAGIKTKTGNYMKRIKRGKVWRSRNGAQAVRVYSNAPHAHLVEELEALPGKIEKTLSDKERIQWFASKYAAAKDAFFIGRGLDYAVALEGSLKFKEIS